MIAADFTFLTLPLSLLLCNLKIRLDFIELFIIKQQLQLTSASFIIFSWHWLDEQEELNVAGNFKKYFIYHFKTLTDWHDVRCF